MPTTICTNAAGLVVMVSDGLPTPPAGGARHVLTAPQEAAMAALNSSPHDGLTFVGGVFAARPYVPPPGPPDLSNIDNLDRAFRAMGLLLRDYTNALQAGTHTQKTIAQLKQDFAQKYNNLP
jgi:hypothetical protein